MNNAFWIGGRHAVIAAIKNKNRKIERILVDQSLNKNDINEISNLYKKKIELIKKNQIKKLFLDKNFVHQGFAALLSPLGSVSLKDFIKLDLGNNILLPILEDINDPRNLGSILRSCVAFGAYYVIIKDNSINEKSPYLYKAASGACEKINFIKVSNISSAIKILKQQKFWIYGTDLKSSQYMHNIKLSTGRYAMIFGSEHSGIKRLTKENCDILFKIKMWGEIESLNVSSSCAIILNYFSNQLK